jgi:hypothetical protein
LVRFEEGMIFWNEMIRRQNSVADLGLIENQTVEKPLVP